MEIGINFNDIKSYTDNMSKGLEDKLFFLNKMNFEDGRPYLFVDFGCADGVLLTALYNILSAKGVHAYYIGYDISDVMIDLAKTKFDITTDSVMFTSNWDEVEEKVKTYSKMESVLILSSVIHEVYSYANIENDDIGAFWRKVRNTGFKYICVRDMMCSRDIVRETNIEMAYKVKERIGFATTLSTLCRSFNDTWGNIYLNNKDMVHFLLKYRWRINWDREAKENYFPIYIEELLDRFNENYNLAYFERFRVPFLDKCIKEDFDVELEDYTHIKAVFEMKKVKEG